MFCVYCMQPITPRLTKSGRLHYTQPKTCSAACAKRTAAWDRWIRDGKPGSLPSMPQAEAVQRFQVIGA